jgi:membrane-bound lytic murein transglycosylase D
MNGLRTYLCWLGSLALLSGAVSCAFGRSHRKSFLPPPVPAAHAFYTLDAPPEVADPPNLVSPLPAASFGGQADALVRDADGHFQAGRAHFQEGDAGAARSEFDQAIDLLLSAPEDAPSRIIVDKKLDDLVESIHRLDLAGLGAGDAAELPGFEKPPLEDLEPLTFPIDPALKDKVSEELRATASQLPLQVTDPVLSYINFFSTGRGRKILTYGVQRSGRYKALIRRVLDEEGVPQELIYMAQAESGFQPRAVSRKKATGMWQFMQARGQEYGLLQSAYFDDRLDPEKATRAAARHLRDLYHHFGDWYLAMAAYDCGPVNVDRGVERTGYADFWELRSRNVLPKETANYVPAILAMTIIMKNAKEYGMDGVEGDPALEYETVALTAPTHLQLVADLAECPVSQLHDLNPALLKNIAPGGTPLRVPKGSGASLAAGLETVPPEKRAAWRVHRVTHGENLAAIAQRYRVTKNAILAANRAGASALEAGDLLIIPVAAVREKPAVKRASHARRASAATHSASGKRSRAATYTAANVQPRGVAKHTTAKQ